MHTYQNQNLFLWCQLLKTGEGMWEQTLAMRMKMTKRGLPSSSILGNEGGGGLWNWRACSPLLPLACTTNTRRCLSRPLGFWVVLEENSECLTSTSSCVLELDNGSRTSAFRDIPTSVYVFLLQILFLSLFVLGYPTEFVYWCVSFLSTHDTRIWRNCDTKSSDKCARYTWQMHSG